ncbi:probable murein peptide carboxypeptidase [Filimonas sp.]|nr:probable murein peptide carboxypeptidase [Filimonas sp.]
MTTLIPPYLKPGDTIGITCPAGAVDLTDMKPMFDQLKAWGYQLKIGTTVGTSHFKFSSTDEERLSDLQTMLDDDSIQAILFGRGGYGVVRLIDQIDFTRFRQNPKWLVGYSDITCLHSHIFTNFNIATLHAHMGAGYRAENQDAFSTLQIQEALQGTPMRYPQASHTMNRVGQGSGKLCGGNLALLSDLTGTRSDIDTQDCILVIEDIGEYRYNIDRMLWQLLRAGKLDMLSGLIVGGFTDTLDNEVPFGMTEYEIVWEKVKDFSYPVCFDFPVGHQARNWPLKMGVPCELIVGADITELNELRGD